jgi:glycosyltransferase involved in cell wall biosynthesis
VLVNSNSVKRDVEDVCGTTVPIQTLYNAVDTTVFSSQGATLDLDELCGLPPPAKPVVRVGLLATFARWKGHEVFLRAVSLIPTSIPLRAYIIGDALYQTDGSQYSLAELQALVLQLGTSDRVGFAGFVAEPAAALRSLDVVVHASTQPEPFGMVIIEGMACGRAVIASEAGGAVELIRTTIQTDRQANLETEINALGHSPGDAAQLAERIIQLATDPALRARLGAAGRATVEQHFNSDRLGKELGTIYQSVAVEFVS